MHYAARTEATSISAIPIISSVVSPNTSLTPVAAFIEKAQPSLPMRSIRVQAGVRRERISSSRYTQSGADWRSEVQGGGALTPDLSRALRPSRPRA